MASSSNNTMAASVEGHSTNKPLFNELNYQFWSNRMSIFMRSYDYEMWDVVLDDLYVLIDTVFCSGYIFCFGSRVQISIFSPILVYVRTVRLRVLGYYCQGLYYYLITLCIYILCLIFVYLYSILYIIVLLCTTCHFNIVILIYYVFILVYHIILIIFYYMF